MKNSNEKATKSLKENLAVRIGSNQLASKSAKGITLIALVITIILHYYYYRNIEPRGISSFITIM